MYSEDDLLALSGLQHLVFCERQWALIHLEQAWAENRFTAEGRILHDRAHTDEVEVRGDTRIVRGVRLHSFVLGLSGQADVVEFHRVEDQGVALAGATGLWRPYPVEYKRGKKKSHNADLAQLCAQGLCLEEMLGVDVPEGALFYGAAQRRQAVVFTEALRAETVALAARMQALYASGITPPPVFGTWCEQCSLVERCQPEALGKQRNTRAWWRRQLDALERGEATS